MERGQAAEADLEGCLLVQISQRLLDLLPDLIALRLLLSQGTLSGLFDVFGLLRQRLLGSAAAHYYKFKINYR